MNVKVHPDVVGSPVDVSAIREANPISLRQANNTSMLHVKEGKLMNIHTVNVIHFCGINPTDIVSITSYDGEQPGSNDEAEQDFANLIYVLNPYLPEEELEDAIEDGVYEYGNHTVIISHSV